MDVSRSGRSYVLYGTGMRRAKAVEEWRPGRWSARFKLDQSI